MLELNELISQFSVKVAEQEVTLTSIYNNTSQVCHVLDYYL